MTRKQIIARLKELGYDGPVSYTLPKLKAILEQYASSSAKTKLAQLDHHTHCENCGRLDPGTDEGYTTCCNEIACAGWGDARFGTERDNVTACCWAAAELKFEVAGRPVPEGSCRLPR